MIFYKVLSRKSIPCIVGDLHNFCFYLHHAPEPMNEAALICKERGAELISFNNDRWYEEEMTEVLRTLFVQDVWVNIKRQFDYNGKSVWLWQRYDKRLSERKHLPESSIFGNVLWNTIEMNMDHCASLSFDMALGLRSTYCSERYYFVCRLGDKDGKKVEYKCVKNEWEDFYFKILMGAISFTILTCVIFFYLYYRLYTSLFSKNRPMGENVKNRLNFFDGKMMTAEPVVHDRFENAPFRQPIDIK
ncbi:hypothetical protein SNEBB_011363 [Seison nebaliae]|nr:hypothetical protein SNEBB_011363 [Seison nebaliae]